MRATMPPQGFISSSFDETKLKLPSQHQKTLWKIQYPKHNLPSCIFIFCATLVVITLKDQMECVSLQCCVSSHSWEPWWVWHNAEGSGILWAGLSQSCHTDARDVCKALTRPLTNGWTSALTWRDSFLMCNTIVWKYTGARPPWRAGSTGARTGFCFHTREAKQSRSLQGRESRPCCPSPPSLSFVSVDEISVNTSYWTRARSHSSSYCRQ